MSRRARSAARRPTPLDPLQTTRKGQAAYHALRCSILLGHLEPGDMLLEQRIAEQLSCSQGTVREAFLRLEQDGLVERRGYRGTVVSTTSVQEAAQMVEIRIQIETAGVRRSAGALGGQAVAELVSITEQMDKAAEGLDFYRYSELDREFHITLFRQSGLPALEPMLKRCTLHIHRFTFHHAEIRRPEDSIGDKHRALLRAVQAGDPDSAAAAIHAHIGDVIERGAPPIEEEVRRLRKSDG